MWSAYLTATPGKTQVQIPGRLNGGRLDGIICLADFKISADAYNASPHE